MMVALSNSGNEGGDAGPPARSRSRWILALIALILLTEQTALGFQLIAPALIGFAAEFQTTQVIWMITIWALVGAVVTPLAGKLGDQYGKRKILLIAAAISIVGGIVCATAPNFEVMLIGRALMAPSYVFLPVCFPLIRDVFPANFRIMAISIAANGVGVVAIAGPFIAGLIIDNISYGAVFWFVVILTALGSLGVLALVPETTVRSRSRIDYVGAVGLTVGFLLLMVGISQLPSWGIGDIKTIGTLVGGLVVLALWWAWELRTDEPFIPPQLLSRRPVAPVLLTYAFAGGAFTVIGSYLPMMIQTPRAAGIDYGFGVGATGVAGVMVLGGLLTVAGGFIVGWLAPRFGYRPLLIIAPACGAVGAVGLAFLRSQIWMPALSYGLVGLAYMTIAAGTALLMVVTPKHFRGVTAGMLSALGGAVGSLFAQIGGLALANNISQVVQGQPIFTGTGMAQVFMIGAGLFVVAAIIAVFCPGKAEVDSKEAEEAALLDAEPATPAEVRR